jgi:hypothetical protein
MLIDHQRGDIADVADATGLRPRYVRDTSAIGGTFQPISSKDLRSTSATSAISETIAHPRTHTYAYAHHAHAPTIKPAMIWSRTSRTSWTCLEIHP